MQKKKKERNINFENNVVITSYIIGIAFAVIPVFKYFTWILVLFIYLFNYKNKYINKKILQALIISFGLFIFNISFNLLDYFIRPHCIYNSDHELVIDCTGNPSISIITDLGKIFINLIFIIFMLIALLKKDDNNYYLNNTLQKIILFIENKNNNIEKYFKKKFKKTTNKRIKTAKGKKKNGKTIRRSNTNRKSK